MSDARRSLAQRKAQERDGNREPNVSLVRAVTHSFAGELAERRMTVAEGLIVTESLFRALAEDALEGAKDNPEALEAIRHRLVNITESVQSWVMAWPTSVENPT